MHIDRRTLLGLLGLAAVGVPTAGCISSAAGNPGHVTAPADRPAVDDDTLGALVQGNADFGVDLLAAVADASGTNTAVSPLSVAACLGMVRAGAIDETAAEMDDTLRFPDDVHAALGALAYDLEDAAQADEALELAIANAVWMQANFAVEDTYLETLKENYGAEATDLDFVADPEGSRETINDWTADATNDLIEELFPEGAFTGDTRLVLTNAVYLLADWITAFDPDDTTDVDFTNLDGSTTATPMMQQTEEFRAFGGDDRDHVVVELPYVGGDLTMVCILPPEDDFVGFVERIDGAWLLETFDELEVTVEREINLSLPRFTFDTEATLSEHLTDLGMPRAFDPNRAQFDAISSAQLFLNEVYHDTYVAVDEEGTEAAAATGSEMRLVSAPAGITFDRPFLFAIRHRDTNAVLFFGQVVDASDFD